MSRNPRGDLRGSRRDPPAAPVNARGQRAGPAGAGGRVERRRSRGHIPSAASSHRGRPGARRRFHRNGRNRPAAGVAFRSFDGKKDRTLELCMRRSVMEETQGELGYVDSSTRSPIRDAIPGSAPEAADSCRWDTWPWCASRISRGRRARPGRTSTHTSRGKTGARGARQSWTGSRPRCWTGPGTAPSAGNAWKSASGSECRLGCLSGAGAV